MKPGVSSSSLLENIGSWFLLNLTTVPLTEPLPVNTLWLRLPREDAVTLLVVLLVHRVATVRFGSVSRNLTCLITARFGFSSEIGSVRFGYYGIFSVHG